MKRLSLITGILILGLSMTGCEKEPVDTIVETPKAPDIEITVPSSNETSISENTEPIIDADTVLKNNEQELAKVERNNRDISDNNGTLVFKEEDADKLKTVDFVKTAKTHNLYCLFEYNGSEEPIITFTSPSGEELSATSTSIEYFPKGEYNLGISYEIMNAEAGDWLLHIMPKGSTIISYSVTDLTDFTLNLYPTDLE